MNNFTKEELEMISQAMRGYVCDFECFKLYSSAKDKLQSMIDNYCEHEELYRFEYATNTIAYCDKCKTIMKVMNDNQ